VDPIEEGEAHPMWEEVSLHAECSARKKWIERFLDDEQTPEKESTFLTPETSSLFFGALVITPQRGGVPDITTLVKLMIERDQHGRFRARPELVSISETPIVTWVTLCSITCVLAVMKAIKCRNHRFLRSKIFSLIESLAVVVYISVNVYMEFSPPHVIEELTDAFLANDQDAYFKCFTGLLEYSAALEELKLYGFCLIVVLFFRVIAMLDIHPRLGFVHRVAERCADDMMHFFLQFFIVILVLTFLAFWSFSQRRPEFSTMSWSLYVLFQYFAGDFNWDDTPEDIRYISFLIIYVFVIFVMMVNFLLAIVVNAHSAVMDAVKDNETEQNVIWDLGDLVRYWVISKRYRWPSPERVRAMVDRNLLEYHEHEHAEGVALPGFPAVTLQELLSDKSVFEHVHGAQAWLHYYAKKMNVLREERKSLRFQRGHCILDETASTSAELSLREG
jgi:hypothetical protein